MTKQEFTTRIESELTNLLLTKPDLFDGLESDGSGPMEHVRITKLKDGFRATVYRVIGKPRFEMDWRSNNPTRLVISVEVPSGFTSRFKPVANIKL